MSTPVIEIPVIPLWDLLLVPLQGDVTDAQADALTLRVLQWVRRASVRAVVVDLSGLELIDSHFCAGLAHLARSAGLMGARVHLCGLQPDVALTLLTMGLELPDVRMSVGLEACLSQLGIVRLADGETPAETMNGDEDGRTHELDG